MYSQLPTEKLPTISLFPYALCPMLYALCSMPLALRHKFQHWHGPFLIQLQVVSGDGIFGHLFQGLLEFGINLRSIARHGSRKQVDKPHFIGATGFCFTHDQVATAVAFKLRGGWIEEEIHFLLSFSFYIFTIEFDELPVDTGQGNTGAPGDWRRWSLCVCNLVSICFRSTGGGCICR